MPSVFYGMVDDVWDCQVHEIKVPFFYHKPCDCLGCSGSVYVGRPYKQCPTKAKYMQL